jgi:hypothetical protein
MLDSEGLSYVSYRGGVVRLGLDRIDIDLTERLNRERGVEVRLRR